jgi:hypothetical protein
VPRAADIRPWVEGYAGVIFARALVLACVLYVVWRIVQVWEERRRERRRQEENQIWMRKERARRGAEPVGILRARERERGEGMCVEGEAHTKRVRFVEAVGASMEDSGVESSSSVEADLGDGKKVDEDRFSDEALGDLL